MRADRFLTSVLLAPDALAAGGGFLVFLGITAVVAFFANRHYVAPAPVQPVEFNHKVHVEDEGLECSMCHAHYENDTSSGLPAATVCALCHLDEKGESEEEQKLTRLLEEGAPLEWDSLFRQPPHVFFSHRRHVAVAGLECVTCHGDIGSSERPPRERTPLAMETCIECHRREGASTGCIRCHR